MDALLPLAAFLFTFFATTRTLGAGLAAVLAVGYVNGVVRANVLTVFATFMFDAAVLGFYAAAFATRGAAVRAAAGGTTGLIVLFLIGWPTLLAVIPVNHPLVQLVALRGTIWFLPVVLIARRLSSADLTTVARASVALNLVALAGGVWVLTFGIESLFPHNAVTDLMYRSRDVAGGTSHRVPSLFLNAHSYGGMMVMTLPLVIDLLVRPGASAADRAAGAAGTAAAIAGVLMCAARSPIVMLVAVAPVFWLLTRMSVRVGAAIAALAAGGAYLASTDDRLQRAVLLSDTDAVATRVRGSANEEFLLLVVEYPFGAGLGSSVGTSVPFFLAEHTPTPVGLENEYSRILVDQGWLGLAGWLGFVGWLLLVPPRFDPRRPWAYGRPLMYAVVAASWGTAFIGSGLLSAVPVSVLMLAYIGVLSQPRDPLPGRPR